MNNPVAASLLSGEVRPKLRKAGARQCGCSARAPEPLDTMRALRLERYGFPEVLRMRRLTRPMPCPGEVRVKVRMIGINYPEVLSRMGLYGWAPMCVERQ